jgi:hypothetical protein
MKGAALLRMALSVLFVALFSLTAAAADVYLLNSDGRVWLNGKPKDELSTRVKITAVDLAGSQKMKGIPIVNDRGELYVNGTILNINPPFRFPAAACFVVGLEPYILDGAKGEVWRYYREGAGQGAFKKEENKGLLLSLPCVDMAVVGPEEDKTDRTVYVLASNSKVFIDGKEAQGAAPTVGLNKPQAIAVEDKDVYLLDGSNGKVYGNGKHDQQLSTHVFVECVDFTVKDGIAYILTKDGAVYVNGKRDPSVSSNVKSDFVAIFAK